MHVKTYNLTIMGKQYYLKRYDKITLLNKEYLFIGGIGEMDPIPNINCFFIMNGVIKFSESNGFYKDSNEDVSNYSVTILGKRHILKRYMKVIYNGIYYIFLGFYKDGEPTPNVNCFYIVNNEVIFNTIDRANIPKDMPNRVVTMPETRMSGDDQVLKLEIRNDDDYLMIMMKTLLIERGITVGDFKSMYGEARKTDMNNDKSRLENKNTLSWNKFTYLLGLLGHTYELNIFDETINK